MSKYYLVASYYNMKKTEYENETIIKSLSGINFTSLSKIDEFTTRHTTSEIIKKIEEEQGKTGFNHLAILYLKSKNSKPIPYRVIENDKRFNKTINTSADETHYILGKQRNTNYVNRGNELYIEQSNILKNILETKDYEKFLNIYPYDNDFNHLVKRYIDSSYDTEEARITDLNLILLEFSRYKTFRGWYSNQLKIKNNINIRRPNQVEQVILPKKSTKVTVHTTEENMAFFESRFKEKTGKSYNEYTTEEYNRDNEEYLSEEEYASMNDYEEDNKIRGRRH